MGLALVHLGASNTGATSYHMSGKITKDSQMIFRKEGVNMGLKSFSEHEIWQTSSKLIEEAKNTIESLN